MRAIAKQLAVCSVALLMLGALVVPAAAQGGDGTQISAMEFRFNPFDAPVELGQTVTWTNEGTATHSMQGANGEFYGLINPGDSFMFEPAEAGEINYFCTFHGTPTDGMHGYLSVFEEGEEVPPPREQPQPEFSTVEAAGDSNIDTAIAWTQRIPDDGSQMALLGRDDDFADLLAAGATGLPLLVTPTDSLDDRVQAELARLGATNVVVLGGEAAISQDVVDALEADGREVERIEGATRLETATAIAVRFFGDVGETLAQPPPGPPAPEALIARARGTEDNPTAGFADSIGAAAAGVVLGVPVLLSDTDGLSEATRQHLVDTGVGHVALIGGEAALSQAVADDLEGIGVTSDRVGGDSRDETAVVLKEYVDGFPSATYGNVVIVDGFNENAWIQGFGAAAQGSVVLLSNGDDVPAITQDALVVDTEPVLQAIVGAKSVLCAPGVSGPACDLIGAVVTTGFIGPQVLVGFLEGSEETQASSPVASGIFMLSPVSDGGGVCYQYLTIAIGSPEMPDPIVAAHIHRGAEGVAGDPVIPLSTAGAFDGESNGCILDGDQELVEEIFANPGDFYANVHSEAFPAGAVRDNLFAFDDLYVADLSGDQEVPGPGAQMAGGVSFLTFNEDQDLCHLTITGGLNEPLIAQHVHVGDFGDAGPVSIALTVSPIPGVPVHADCIEDTDQAAAADFQADPAGHYVNVHTESFPDGAIRGQTNIQYGPPVG